MPVAGGRNLQAGQQYICSNAFAGQLLLSQWRVVINDAMWSLRLLLNARPYYPELFDPSKDWNGKDIWLCRAGGFGDLLMLTPTIRHLSGKWPDCRIHVACGRSYWSIFDGLDVIPEEVPMLVDQLPEIDAMVSFEEIVEGTPDAEKVTMAQLFANQLGIKLDDRTPDYRCTLDEIKWAFDEYPQQGMARVGIQFLASAYYRSYPDMTKVLVGIAKKAQVFLLGAPGQIQLKDSIPNVFNLMDRKFSFRQSAAVVATCDACVSPDSALVHLCSALKVPCVALYGPFPSHLRSTSHLAYCFNGQAPCSPCFFHAETPEQFPAGMPCTEKKRCVAMDSIDPDRVIQKALSLAKAL